MRSSQLPVVGDRALHVGDGVDQSWRTWVTVPRMVERLTNNTRDGREWAGVCRDHGWLSLPVSYPQDVPNCPDCEAALDAGHARYATAVASGWL